jgi:DNA (cytosine-5)-methyltransferase 1
MNLTHVDLFSGIGGFSLAARWAGIETIVFCERDKFCQKVLNKHWPGVPIHDDITTFDGTKYSDVFLLTGGFPCQPFSCAGKRRGKEDDRYLWPEMFRVIEAVRPAWVIFENVPGIVKLALDEVLTQMESIGYACQTFIIPAAGVNAPHRRDRVWVVAHTSCELFDNGGKGQPGCEVPEPGNCCGSVSSTYADGEQAQRPTIPRSQHGGRLIESGMGRASYGISERLDRNNWPDDWERDTPRVNSGVPQRAKRLRALGNAVVPQIVEEIGKMILRAIDMQTERTCETCIHAERVGGELMCIVGPERFPLKDTSPCTDGLWMVGEHTADYWS